MTENSSPTDRWIKCISTPGNIRGVAVQATGLIQSMADRHGLEGIGARGLGEAVLAALLVASYCKAEERINLNIQGSRHYLQALVDAYPDGAVRGYVIERTLSKQELKEPETTGPWGTGILSVLRTKDEEGRQPYIGTVPLLTGFLAKDLTFYWAQSEQIPSAVGLVVNMQDNRVSSAGGFLVQALPGATESEVRAIEHQIHHLQSLAQQVAKKEEPIHLLSQIFQDLTFIVIEERPVCFRCNCSWERVERALTLVGPSELRAMLNEDGNAIVKCDFCTHEYQVDAPALERLIQKLKPA